MKQQETHTIYTIGHSTHSIEEFINMLRSFHIQTLADIRRFPGSLKYPQFNKESLRESLERENIPYIHLEGLGGRRKAQKDSRNDRWRNISFRGYADYMETEDFERAVSEAVWWRCHRALVSDYLKAKGWQVWHILASGKAEEHPYTSPARIVGTQVLYSDPKLPMF
jgi:uncharacterized protein (DUF488 family)